MLLLKKDATHNLNMKSAYLHLLADMLTSVAVLIGGLSMKFYQTYLIDAILTLAISIYLIYMSWKILVDSVKILMLFAPNHIIINDIVDKLNLVEGISNVHHVHIWQLNDKECHFEAHVEFKNNVKLSEFDLICEKLEHILANDFNIHHSNLQPEFNRKDSKEIIIQD